MIICHKLGLVYILFISTSYFLSTYFRFSFIVGVNNPFYIVNYYGIIQKSCTCWARDIAFALAFFNPYIIIFFNLSSFIPYFTVFTWQPLSLKYYCELLSTLPLFGGSSFNATRQVKYFFISPISITLDINGKAAFI